MVDRNELLAVREQRISGQNDDFDLDEFAIVELDDRLEFVNCCNANCNCNNGKGSG